MCLDAASQVCPYGFVRRLWDCKRNHVQSGECMLVTLVFTIRLILRSALEGVLSSWIIGMRNNWAVPQTITQGEGVLRKPKVTRYHQLQLTAGLKIISTDTGKNHKGENKQSGRET